MKKPIVYICAPYSGTPERIQENIAKVRKYCCMAAAQGFAPFAAHLAICGFLNDNIPEQRQLGIEIDEAFMEKCNELWVFGSRISSGMTAEIEWFKRAKKPIRWFSEDGIARPNTEGYSET